ncbi:TPA: hypothetical protein N0F65_005541 [Lagenidium giganteum]|uniref:Uncharacterized protein n=1 Tax=Lagenidium giganteum TaxID=4803 RepID=A0AAV2YVY4_9STRA|nr:TPA: hypothetical protein N0F65_005541 [Lagenidium giganteum]
MRRRPEQELSATTGWSALRIALHHRQLRRLRLCAQHVVPGVFACNGASTDTS